MERVEVTTDCAEAMIDGVEVMSDCAEGAVSMVEDTADAIELARAATVSTRGAPLTGAESGAWRSLLCMF
jgi:hypothetical protein